MTRYFGTPRASAASRIEPGTSRSASSEVRATNGMMMTANASAPAIALNTMPGKAIWKVAKMNKPMTMDGRPVMTSAKNRTAKTRGPFPYSAR